MPVGFMLSATIVQQELAAIRVEGAIATVLFYIPILQHLCRWFGSRYDRRPATSDQCRIDSVCRRHCSIAHTLRR